MTPLVKCILYAGIRPEIVINTVKVPVSCSFAFCGAILGYDGYSRPVKNRCPSFVRRKVIIYPSILLVGAPLGGWLNSGTVLNRYGFGQFAKLLLSFLKIASMLQLLKFNSGYLFMSLCCICAVISTPSRCCYQADDNHNNCNKYKIKCNVNQNCKKIENSRYCVYNTL